MVAPNIDDICPHCGGVFKKPPQRKTICKTCGQPVSVKYRPSDEVRRLVTEAQAFEIDREWTQHHEAQAATGAALSIGVEADAIAAALLSHDSSGKALRELCFAVIYSPASPHTRMMAANTISIDCARSPGERMKMQRMASMFNLEQVTETAGRCDIQHFVVRSQERDCASCRPYLGKRYTLDEAKRVVIPPDDCPRVSDGCLCGLDWAADFSAWDG